jgi:hypothetical protein
MTIKLKWLEIQFTERGRQRALFCLIEKFRQVTKTLWDRLFSVRIRLRKQESLIRDDCLLLMANDAHDVRHGSKPCTS